MENVLNPAMEFLPPPPPPLPFNYPHPPSAFLPPPPPLPRPNLSPFYYGLVVIGSTAVVLAIYNIIVVGWCRPRRESQQRRNPTNQSLPEFTSRSCDENSNSQLISTFKYRKELEKDENSFNNECVVCLSIFEDGQDVRQLSLCKHSFHAPCIDMWLYSHSDCPLCRTIVGPPRVSHPPVASLQEENDLIAG